MNKIDWLVLVWTLVIVAILAAIFVAIIYLPLSWLVYALIGFIVIRGIYMAVKDELRNQNSMGWPG